MDTGCDRGPKFWISVCLALAFGVVAPGLGAETSGAGGRADAVPVTAARVERAEISLTIPLMGSIYASRFSRLSAQVSGLVSSIAVEEGAFVREGALLFELDATIAKLNMLETAAARERAEAALEEAKRRRDEAIRLARDAVIAATELAALEAAVAMAGAELRRSEAQEERVKAIVAYHRVSAPFPGVVGRRAVEVGEWIGPGDELITLAAVDVVRAQADVPQQYFSRVDVGAGAAIELDALPGRRLQGEVTRKIAIGAMSARTFPIQIDLENPGREIAPGMSARVRLHLRPGAAAESASFVPRDAILRRPGGIEVVWVILEAGGNTRVEPVTVSTGRVQGDRVEVSGVDLAEGARVVVLGNETLQAGQAVRIIR